MNKLSMMIFFIFSLFPFNSFGINLSTFEPEKNTSLSSKELKYRRLKVYQTDPSEKEDTLEFYKPLLLTLYQALDVHNALNALNDYDDICSEQEVSKKVITQTQSNYDTIKELIINKNRKDNLSMTFDQMREKFNEEVFGTKDPKYSDIKKSYFDLATGCPEIEIGEAGEDKNKITTDVLDSCLYKNWNIGREILKEAYSRANATKPLDVQFFSLSEEKVDDNGYENIPILEGTKYLKTAVKSSLLKEGFYKIPKVWEESYKTIWKKCVKCLWPGDLCKKPASSGKCCSNKLTSGEFYTADKECEECAQSCEERLTERKEVNLRQDGEWSRYMTAPDLSPKPSRSAKIKYTPSVDLRKFRSRFEDLEETEVSLLRAEENKKQLEEIEKIMQKTIKKSFTFVADNLSATGVTTNKDLITNLTCESKDPLRQNFKSLKTYLLEEIRKHFASVLEDETLSLSAIITRLKKDKKDSLRGLLEMNEYTLSLLDALNRDSKELTLLTEENLAYINDLIKAQDAINSTPSASEVYLQEAQDFIRTRLPIWQNEIY